MNSKVIGADVYKDSKEVKSNIEVVISFEHVFNDNDLIYQPLNVCSGAKVCKT